MKESQFYGGSAQEAKDGQAVQAARDKAIKNGFSVRREKRGKEIVLIITPNDSPVAFTLSGGS